MLWGENFKTKTIEHQNVDLVLIIILYNKFYLGDKIWCKLIILKALNHITFTTIIHIWLMRSKTGA